MLTDGRRYAVVQDARGVTHVRDTRAGASFTTDPAGQWSLIGTGGGQVAWSCLACRETANHGYRLDSLVLTIGNRQITRPRAIDFASPSGGGDFALVGRHWLYGQRTVGSGGWQEFWFNWRTGLVRGEHGARSAMDLDNARLGPRLCAPLRREPLGRPPPFPGWRQRFVDYSYEPPFGLWRASDGDLMLDRCGRAKPVRIGRVRTTFDPPSDEQLGGGLVTWFHHGAAHLRALQSGRRRTWAVPSRGTIVQHTRRRIFVSWWRDGAYRVATAKVPKTVR